MVHQGGHRLRSTSLSVAVLLGACSSVVGTATVPPTATTATQAATATPWIPVTPSGLTCGSLFPAPDYAGFAPVPGITVRAIDQGHVEISNATAQPYYFALFYWEAVDNLVCGRGVTVYDPIAGPVHAGSTFVVEGGSTDMVPATVSIWSDPCGEACTQPPIGQYVVPISDVPAPSRPIL
jgi:hypothetical protein